MALPEANKTSKALLTLFHVGLFLNWIFVWQGLLPVIGIIPVTLILLYEQVKKTPLSESALHFAWKRLIFHAILIVSIAIFSVGTSFSQEMFRQAYILLSYVLIPLSAYDAYRTYQGGLGLELLRPLKEKVRKIRG